MTESEPQTIEVKLETVDDEDKDERIALKAVEVSL